MHRFLYTLAGVVMIGAAVYAFGVRQFGVDPAQNPSKLLLGQRTLEWSVDGEPRTWFDGDGSGHHRTPWFTASKALDLLNALIGVLGVALMFNGADRPARGRRAP